MLLDIDPEVALERATRRPGHMEFYEKVEVQKRNRRRYLDLVPMAAPFLAPRGKVLVIDATGTPEEVETEIETRLGF